MASTKKKVIEYLKKHLNSKYRIIEKYLKNTQIPKKEQELFADKLKSYYNIKNENDKWTIVAGFNYCITSKNASNLKDQKFRSLVMAFKTLSICVDMSKSYKIPTSVSKKFKESGAQYAAEWARRAEKLLNSRGHLNANYKKDLVKYDLLDTGSELGDQFWKCQAEYFKKLGIDENILNNIKKAYNVENN